MTRILSAGIHIPPRLTDDESKGKRFERCVFLGAGSVSDPNKGYHLELVCRYEKFAATLCDIMAGLGISAKFLPRKSSYIVYLKGWGAGFRLHNPNRRHEQHHGL